jgi:hypothetical protein
MLQCKSIRKHNIKGGKYETDYSFWTAAIAFAGGLRRAIRQPAGNRVK